MSPGPPWWAAIPRKQWPDGLAEEMDKDGAWDEEGFGDRRTELVCIGRELDAKAACTQLAGCCLTDEEMAALKEDQLALEDPYAEAWEISSVSYISRAHLSYDPHGHDGRVLYSFQLCFDAYNTL